MGLRRIRASNPEPQRKSCVVGAACRQAFPLPRRSGCRLSFQEDDCEDLLRFSGGSLSDYTRIASSSPQMWRDVFSSNKDNVLKAISNFKNSLSEMEEAIRNDDRGLLENVIKKAYKARREKVK